VEEKPMLKTAKILIIAGGTGGHIFPALAVADILSSEGAQVFWLGSEIGLEKTLVPERYPMTCIAARRIRGKGWRTYLAAPWRLLISACQAYRAIRRLRPDVVLAMGGFVSGPGGVAAKLLGIPLVVHEQNAVAGYTNRVLAKLANAVAAAYPGAFAASANATIVGNPVRAEISAIPAPAQRLADRAGPLRILVLGGSQGAHALNQLIINTAADFSPPQALELWHQTGKNDFEDLQQRYARITVKVKLEPFITDMGAAYQWADLMICRAGALTVAEITAAGIASILMPFPAAVDDHQWHNGQYLQQAGAAKLIREAELTPVKLTALLQEILQHRALTVTMAEKARALAQPHAAQAVAAMVIAQLSA
jgi:UDP-N-acetylglucosamine--N-acetylmuramyl-(pentapeptide) pyrophosphoryl-undecaprenol N-acetylglucosamine transferase